MILKSMNLNKLLVLPLLFILLFNNEVKSQTYIPFPNSNASWVDNEGCCLETYYRVDVDTVVNGLLYHELWLYELDAS